MNRERWDAIKALRPQSVRLTNTTGGPLKRATPKKRRPSPVARHLNAQHRDDPARTRRLEVALAARDRQRVPKRRKVADLT